jgi:hypothetical protein
MPAGLAVAKDFARIGSIDDMNQPVLAVQEAVEKSRKWDTGGLKKGFQR